MSLTWARFLYLEVTIVVASFSEVGVCVQKDCFGCHYRLLKEQRLMHDTSFQLKPQFLLGFASLLALPFCFFRKMAMAILKELLQGYMNSLCDEGLMNDHFLSLEDTSEPQCVVQMIEKYSADVDMILSELSRHVEDSKVDFCRLASVVHEIEDKSASIGAEHMKLACSELIKACDEKNKRSFSRSVLWLEREFSTTKDKLASVVQMERRIMRLMSSQSQN